MSFIEALKDAAWEPHSHLSDPLENDATSPHAAIPNFERKGRSLGEGVGAIGGGLAGLAMPALAGFATGAAGAYGLEHLMGGSPELGSGLQLAGGALGAGLAAPLGLVSAPVGAGIGAMHGKNIGGFAGRQVEKLYSPERQAAERIRRMPANHGLALLRTMERTGQGMPEEIEAMKQTYNTRRDSFRDQARAMVI